MLYFDINSFLFVLFVLKMTGLESSNNYLLTFSIKQSLQVQEKDLCEIIANKILEDRAYRIELYSKQISECRTELDYHNFGLFIDKFNSSYFDDIHFIFEFDFNITITGLRCEKILESRDYKSMKAAFSIFIGQYHLEINKYNLSSDKMAETKAYLFFKSHVNTVVRFFVNELKSNQNNFNVILNVTQLYLNGIINEESNSENSECYKKLYEDGCVLKIIFFDKDKIIKGIINTITHVVSNLGDSKKGDIYFHCNLLLIMIKFSHYYLADKNCDNKNEDFVFDAYKNYIKELNDTFKQEIENINLSKIRRMIIEKRANVTFNVYLQNKSDTENVIRTEYGLVIKTENKLLEMIDLTEKLYDTMRIYFSSVFGELKSIFSNQ